MLKILMIILYFPLDALHFWLLCGYNHTTARRIGIYEMRCTAYKVAPDDGLIQSETCRASNEKIKSNHRILSILLFDIRIVSRRCTVHTTLKGYVWLVPLTTTHRL